MGTRQGVQRRKDRRIYIYGTVLRQPERGASRMWYNRAFRTFYSTSHEGLCWQRPVLNLDGENNAVALDFHSPSIIRDETEPDSARRYKVLGCKFGVSDEEARVLETRFRAGWPYRDRAYYAAYSADGLKWEPYPVNPVLPGDDTITLAIARAAWRLDGLVSLHGGNSQGMVETVLFRPEGNRLTVNADVARGRLAVEVVDSRGEVMLGYGKGSCIPLAGRGVQQVVQWETHRRLPMGQPVQLSFYWDHGDLYSYSVQ